MTPRAAALRYARALFDVALKEHADLDLVLRDLRGFAGLMAEHEALRRVLVNPAVPAARKRAVVETLLGHSDQPSPILSKLLVLLAEGDRLTLVPELAAAFERRLMDHRQIVQAELSTAVELPADRIAVLREGLAQATGREVRVQTRVNPALVGGAVARIGSTVFDGSVMTQLHKLKQSLIDSAQ